MLAGASVGSLERLESTNRRKKRLHCARSSAGERSEGRSVLEIHDGGSSWSCSIADGTGFLEQRRERASAVGCCLDVRASDSNFLAGAVAAEKARLKEIGQQVGGDTGAAEA